MDKKTIIIIVLVIGLFAGGPQASKAFCKNLAGEGSFLGNWCRAITDEAVEIVESAGVIPPEPEAVLPEVELNITIEAADK